MIQDNINQVLEDMSSQLNDIYQHVRAVDEQLDSMRVGLSRDKARVNADIVNISNRLTQISHNVGHIEKVMQKFQDAMEGIQNDIAILHHRTFAPNAVNAPQTDSNAQSATLTLKKDSEGRKGALRASKRVPAP